MAVPYGLPKEEAVKAVTIIPARMYGVDDVLGSIEKGKMANLVVTDGHLLEPKTHVTELFIRGKKVDLTAGDDYKLYEKFRKRPVVKK
jgi:imidazolonepropionase-like amidohydrolase